MNRMMIIIHTEMFELIKFVWFLQSGSCFKESAESEVWEQEESGSEWPCCDGGHVEAGKSGFILFYLYEKTNEIR